jgi:hypothetical protein
MALQQILIQLPPLSVKQQLHFIRDPLLQPHLILPPKDTTFKYHNPVKFHPLKSSQWGLNFTMSFDGDIQSTTVSFLFLYNRYHQHVCKGLQNFLKYSSY